MKKIAVSPPSGMTFDTLFAKECPWYAPGTADRWEYLLREQLALSGYKLCSAEQMLDASVIAIIHWSDISFSLLKQYPEKRHIYYGPEPHIVRPYHTHRGLRYLSRLMDQCITSYEMNVDRERGLSCIPGAYNYEVSFSAALPYAERPFLLATVSADKNAKDPKELYSQRRAVIDWFEENAPGEFHFWGAGWRESYRRYHTYGGQADCKLTCLSQAKFALCFENVKETMGCISEKLFDAMFAETVPIYWGADNITDYVPADCFIDYRTLKSPENLYAYLNSMHDETYQAYRQNIKAYLASDATQKLSYVRMGEALISSVESEKRAHPTALDVLIFKANLYAPVVWEKLHRLFR